MKTRLGSQGAGGGQSCSGEIKVLEQREEPLRSEEAPQDPWAEAASLISCCSCMLGTSNAVGNSQAVLCFLVLACPSFFLGGGLLVRANTSQLTSLKDVQALQEQVPAGGARGQSQVDGELWGPCSSEPAAVGTEGTM